MYCKLKISSGFIGLSLILSGGCTRYVADPDACYNDKVKQIIVTNCATAGCHNPTDKKEGYDFTSYEGVMKAVKAKHSGQSELYNVLNAKGDERMPPAYSLSQDEKDIIKHWINNGAPNNSCSSASCDTNTFSYSVIEASLKTNCLGCHNSNNASAGVILNTHTNVVASAKNNKLLGSVKHETGYSAMPQYSAKLNDCDIKVLEKWINAGMPDN